MPRSTARSVLAGSAIVAATALMWSDTAITWWTNIIEFALRVNESATTGVLERRPTGDADLHALVWGACALLVAYAVRGNHHSARVVTAVYVDRVRRTSSTLVHSAAFAPGVRLDR